MKTTTLAVAFALAGPLAVHAETTDKMPMKDGMPSNAMPMKKDDMPKEAMPMQTGEMPKATEMSKDAMPMKGEAAKEAMPMAPEKK